MRLQRLGSWRANVPDRRLRCTLPAAYRPAVQQRLGATLDGTLSATTAPAIRFAPTGVVQITGLPPVAYNDLLSVHGSYHL
jgi:hypothetical protein